MAARSSTPDPSSGRRRPAGRGPATPPGRQAPARALAAGIGVVVVLAAIVLLGVTTNRPQGSNGPDGSVSLSPSGGDLPSSAPPSESPSGSPDQSVAPLVAALRPPGGSDRGYLTTLSELQATVARAKAGEQPSLAAVSDLLSWVSGALAQDPQPAATLEINGTTGPFVDDTSRAYGLALAYGVSGDLQDAQAARRIVVAWVSTTTATSSTCPQDGACQTSLVIGRTAPAFVFAVDLIAQSGVWSPTDDAAFRAWLREVILPAASLRDNNWGDAGLLLRVAGHDWLNDTGELASDVADWRRRIDLLEPDGSIPEETRRGTSGMLYTQEALTYKLAVARILERRGTDLWSAANGRGGSLKEAVDLLADYWAHPEDWPFEPEVSLPDPGPMWELAYEHWPEPAYARIIENARPFGADGHSAVRWTTLTDGVRITS